MRVALVYIDRYVGAISRYEFSNTVLRKTHGAVLPDDCDRPILFAAEDVHRYLSHPPGDHDLRGPSPIPGGDRPGGTPAAAEMARAA